MHAVGFFFFGCVRAVNEALALAAYSRRDFKKYLVAGNFSQTVLKSNGTLTNLSPGEIPLGFSRTIPVFSQLLFSKQNKRKKTFHKQQELYCHTIESTKSSHFKLAQHCERDVTVSGPARPTSSRRNDRVT